MNTNTFQFKSKVWIWPGESGWHFISLPTSLAEKIIKNFGHEMRGWGSLPVEVSIGQSIWKTSIFKDKKNNSFLLPLKAVVRKKESISEGNVLKIKLTIL